MTENCRPTKSKRLPDLGGDLVDRGQTEETLHSQEKPKKIGNHLDSQVWRRSVAQCVHVDAYSINVKVKINDTELSAYSA